MKYMMRLRAWGQNVTTVFFDEPHGCNALEAARGLLHSCCPLSVQVCEHVEGKGYTKELLDENNHERVGL